MSWITGLIGAILAAIASWAMGYLQPGAAVGAGGVAVNGQTATLLLSLLGFYLPRLVTASLANSLRSVWERFRSLKPSTNESAAATQRASECALFFRQILKDDNEAQVLIDELLTRSTRVCSGITGVAGLSVQAGDGGVLFSQKKAEN